MTSCNRRRNSIPTLIIAVVTVTTAAVGVLHAQNVSFGQRVFQDKGDCKFCHGENGDGRGDPRSPGAASNLHNTKLNREQLIEVIACGRPATEMPHFDKYAYEDTNCYGLKGKDWAPMRRAIRIRRL